MNLKEISVINKETKELITRIFEDGEDIKQITSDEYEVVIKIKDPHKCEPIV